ncbi:MAG TPA: hypothetical protein DEF34_06025 [Desulfotomaculum sp.]|nr:hypothetical protein [Desulfotomaculum sp.]
MFGLGKKLLKEHKGSAMIMVSIAMVSLIGFGSLVLDIGNLFLTRNRLNNALDASVLAACQELPDSTTSAGEVVKEYFANHGFDVGALTNYHISEDKKKVTATGQVTVQYFLARVLGIESATVKCTAAAQIMPLTAARGVVPLGIQDQELLYDVKYTLKVASNSNTAEFLGPGNFGVLVLDSTGADSFEDSLTYGYDGVIKVGDTLNTESGNKSGAARDGVNYRVAQCTHACTPSNHDPSCPRIIILPVYETVDVQNNKVFSVKIVGFAAFLMDIPGDKMVGNECYVDGYFINMVVEGEGEEDAEDYGAYAVKLIV